MNVSRFGREEIEGVSDRGIEVGDIQRLKFQRKRMYLSSECKSRNWPSERVVGPLSPLSLAPVRSPLSLVPVRPGGPIVKSFWYPNEPSVSVCNFGQRPWVIHSKLNNRDEDEKLQMASSWRSGQRLKSMSQNLGGISSRTGKSSGIKKGKKVRKRDKMKVLKPYLILSNRV